MGETENGVMLKFRHPAQIRVSGQSNTQRIQFLKHIKRDDGGDQTRRTVRITRYDNMRAAIPFRMADGRNGQPLDGRLRFRVYNLHDSEGLDLDINNAPIPVGFKRG